MNLRPPKFFYRIYRLPIIGDLLCYVGHVFMKLLLPLNLVLIGFERMRYGTSIIWTPRNKKQAIFDGIECLRSHDSEKFLRLTKKQRLVIYYSHNETTTNLFGSFFGLQERYLKLGAEGVACFIVQSLLMSDAVPSINQHRLDDRNLAAQKNAPRKTMEWMQQHSFDSRLIHSYSKVVEKWEQKERFKNLPQVSFDNSTLPSAE